LGAVVATRRGHEHVGFGTECPSIRMLGPYQYRFKMQDGKSVPEMSRCLNMWWTRLDSSWAREKRNSRIGILIPSVTLSIPKKKE
jgi:hypothetical protein